MKYIMLFICLLILTSCASVLPLLKPAMDKGGILNNFQAGGERTTGVSIKKTASTKIKNNSGTVSSGRIDTVQGNGTKIYHGDSVGKDLIAYGSILFSTLLGFAFGGCLGWLFLKRPKDVKADIKRSSN